MWLNAKAKSFEINIIITYNAGINRFYLCCRSEAVEAVFRPKARRCYQLLFRNFLAFCCLTNSLVKDVSLHSIMAYLEFLARNGVSVDMIANNVAANKADLGIYGTDHSLMDHPRTR